MIKFKTFLLLLILMQLFPPTSVALADTGPKPTMEFEFTQELASEQVTITSGVLYECDQPDCSDASPLEELGPQGFYCELQSCSAMGYGFAPYHRIEIEFSDGVTRQSNIFETAGFDSKYTVTVRPEDLLVQAQFNLAIFPRLGMAEILITCVCALVGMGLLAGLILFLRRRSAKN